MIPDPSQLCNDMENIWQLHVLHVNVQEASDEVAGAHDQALQSDLAIDFWDGLDGGGAGMIEEEGADGEVVDEDEEHDEEVVEDEAVDGVLKVTWFLKVRDQKVPKTYQIRIEVHRGFCHWIQKECGLLDIVD